nr:hypothetical protein [Tanacetum cinerariifolium]
MRYRQVQQANGYNGPFLFPGRRGKALSESQASGVFTRLGRGEWTSHDLRKLARTGWADIGIDHLIGELLINHAMGHNVKVYIQSDVMARKRDALEKWHGHLDGKGLGTIVALTGFRSDDSDNSPEATAHKGCTPIQESTIGEAWQKLYNPHEPGDLASLVRGGGESVDRGLVDDWIAARLHHLLIPRHWNALAAKYSTHKQRKVEAIAHLKAVVATTALAAGLAAQKKASSRSADMIVLPDAFYDMNTWDLNGAPESTRRRWRQGINTTLDEMVN